MGAALEALAAAPGGPRLVLVVSHVEALKARVERPLQLAVGAAGSRVANAAPALERAPEPQRERAPEPARGERQPAAGGRPAGEPLAPDPDRAGNVYCGACDQSMGAARAACHLASKKHASSLKRAQRARR